MKSFISEKYANPNNGCPIHSLNSRLHFITHLLSLSASPVSRIYSTQNCESLSCPTNTALFCPSVHSPSACIWIELSCDDGNINCKQPLNLEIGRASCRERV